MQLKILLLVYKICQRATDRAKGIGLRRPRWSPEGTAFCVGRPPCSCRALLMLLFSGHHLVAISQNCRIVESLRLEKTSKIVKSNHQPDTTVPAKPCPEVPYLHIFWTPPGMMTPPPPWAACCKCLHSNKKALYWVRKVEKEEGKWQWTRGETERRQRDKSLNEVLWSPIV